MFAMFTSTLGDYILSGYKPIVSRLPLKGFIAGGGVFAVAHIIYAIAFGYQIYLNEYEFINIGALFGVFIFIALVIIMSLICYRNKPSTQMIVFAFIYLTLICSACTCVFSIAYSSRGIKIISAIGALFFMISDFIIALDVFGKINIPHRIDLIWTFYPIGQILLLLGA